MSANLIDIPIVVNNQASGRDRDNNAFLSLVQDNQCFAPIG